MGREDMITLTIDGKEVKVRRGATILEAAEKAGIEIPTLCYSKRLLPFGACRLCVVQEEGRPRLMPACFTPARDGMKILTRSDAVIKARRTQLQLILINHPLDCPVCDKGGECKLQDYVHEYNVSEVPFPKFERERLPVDKVSLFIERDPNRCILCGQCVRICDEVQGVGELSFVNRGIKTIITTDAQRPLQCEFCGQCISVCPVGALTDRLFKHKTRAWFLEEKTTICGYCPVGCTIRVGVGDNKVYRVRSKEGEGVSFGNLCVKGRFGWEYVESPERLTKPLVKRNGEFVEVEWDEALEEVASALKRVRDQYGGDSISVLGSARLTNEEAYLLGRFARTVLETNNIDHANSSYVALTEGLYEALGYPASTGSIDEIREADLILLIRAELSETHPIIKNEVNIAIRRNRANLIVMNPRKTRVDNLMYARFQTTSINYKPGTEPVLINGLINVIVKKNLIDNQFVSYNVDGLYELKNVVSKYTPDYVESITGVKKEIIEDVATRYAKAKKAIIFVSANQGYSDENDRYIGFGVATLALLTGKVGKPSCAVNILPEKSNAQGAIDMGLLPDFLPGHVKLSDILAKERIERQWQANIPDTKGMRAKEVFSCGKIKAVYIVGEDPISSYPQGEKLSSFFENLDFLVVQDMFFTDTAKFANVILPAVSFMEKEGTYTNLERRVQKIEKVIPKKGDARSDFQIISELFSKMGKPLPFKTPSDVFNEIAKVIPLYRGMNYLRLSSTSLKWPCKDREDQGKVRLYDDGFPIDRAKLIPFDFSPKEIDSPFLLICGPILFHSGVMSKKAPSLCKVSGGPFAEISFEDANELGVKDGDSVKITSKFGEITLGAKVSYGMQKGVIFVPYHFKEVNAIRDKESYVTGVTLKKV